jgi:hypothetical protein
MHRPLAAVERLASQAGVVLGDCGEGKLILRTAWAAQPKPPKPQDAFEMSKQHAVI